MAKHERSILDQLSEKIQAQIQSGTFSNVPYLPTLNSDRARRQSEAIQQRWDEDFKISYRAYMLSGQFQKPYPVICTDESRKPETPPTCRSCSSPATDGGYCAHCGHREFFEPMYRLDVDLSPRNVAARARLAAMDRAERPRETATSRELAKPHPWECDE